MEDLSQLVVSNVIKASNKDKKLASFFDKVVKERLDQTKRAIVEINTRKHRI